MPEDNPPSANDPRPAQPGQHPPPSVPTRDEEYALLVGKAGAAYYLARFRRFEEAGGFALTWNWCAFLFGFWWFLYRKMSFWVIVDLFVVIELCNYTAFDYKAGLVCWFAYMVVCGLLGDYLYWIHVKKQAGIIRDTLDHVSIKSTDTAARRTFFTKDGGPDKLAVWSLGILAGIGFLFVALAGYPNYIRYKGPSKQFEARRTLKSIQSSERDYYSGHDVYATSLDSLDWVPQGFKDRKLLYTYSIDVTRGNKDPHEQPGRVTNTHFKATATANIDYDKTLDIWEITEGGEPKCVQNDIFN